MPKWSEYSADFAFQYRDFIVRTEAARLQDLAIWLRDTGGPIGLMDASVESLGPLWTWFMTFREDGLPGVPTGARAAYYSVLEHPRRAGNAEAERFVGEAIAHYVFRVIEKADQSARWDVYRTNQRDLYWNFPGITVDGRIFQPAMGFFSNFPQRLSSDFGSAGLTVEARESDALVKIVRELYLGSSPQNRNSTSQSSILEPLLQAERIGWGDLIREPPRTDVRVPEPDHTRRPRRHVGDELIFVTIGSLLDDLSAAPPLDEEEAASVLAGLGFQNEEGNDVEASDLKRPHAQLLTPDRAALVDVHTHQGRLRAFLLSPMEPSEKRWKEIVAALQILALSQTAQLAPEE